VPTSQARAFPCHVILPSLPLSPHIRKGKKVRDSNEKSVFSSEKDKTQSAVTGLLRRPQASQEYPVSETDARSTTIGC